MAIIDLELRMTIKTLAAKGQSNRSIARQLELCEGTVRYHLRRIAAGTLDVRSRQRRVAESYREAIDHWIGGHGDLGNLAALHDWPVAEHEYTGSLRSVQRFVPPPPRRASATTKSGRTTHWAPCRQRAIPSNRSQRKVQFRTVYWTGKLTRSLRR